MNAITLVKVLYPSGYIMGSQMFNIIFACVGTHYAIFGRKHNACLQNADAITDDWPITCPYSTCYKRH